MQFIFLVIFYEKYLIRNSVKEKNGVISDLYCNYNIF